MLGKNQHSKQLDQVDTSVYSTPSAQLIAQITGADKPIDTRVNSNQNYNRPNNVHSELLELLGQLNGLGGRPRIEVQANG